MDCLLILRHVVWILALSINREHIYLLFEQDNLIMIINYMKGKIIVEEFRIFLKPMKEYFYSSLNIWLVLKTFFSSDNQFNKYIRATVKNVWRRLLESAFKLTSFETRMNIYSQIR